MNNDCFGTPHKCYKWASREIIKCKGCTDCLLLCTKNHTHKLIVLHTVWITYDLPVSRSLDLLWQTCVLFRRAPKPHSINSKARIRPIEGISMPLEGTSCHWKELDPLLSPDGPHLSLWQEYCARFLGSFAGSLCRVLSEWWTGLKSVLIWQQGPRSQRHYPAVKTQRLSRTAPSFFWTIRFVNGCKMEGKWQVMLLLKNWRYEMQSVVQL